MQNTNNGFSLIELSIVLVIIAAIAGMSMSIGSTQMQVAKINNTQTTLDNAKMALATFKAKTGRLPCPANPALASTNAGYGLEVAPCNVTPPCPAGVICPDAIQVQGAIPFKTINLSESAAYDSWSNKLTYIIDKALTNNASANDNGRIPILDENANEIVNSPVLGKATYVLLSHGSDGKGGYNSNGVVRVACSGSESDVENCDGDAVLTSRQISATHNVLATAGFYEDYMQYEAQKFALTAFAPPAGTIWTKVKNNQLYSCGLTSSKTIYCWGYNDYGKLGDGTTTNRLTPTLVAGGITDWVDVTTDENNTCGRRSTGQIYCWGNNTHGQLGDGTTTNRSAPTLVAGGITDWVAIVTDRFFTCGKRSTGQIYCWGNNGTGQLGDGTTTNRLTPTLVAGGITDWVNTKIDRFNTCGIKSTGQLYCWGYNAYGQLGDGTTTNRFTPTLVAGGITDWVDIELDYYNICGRRSTGQIYCWGYNAYGQLGDGTTTNQFTPTLVAGGITDWVDIALSENRTCGRRSTGQIYCWGYNLQGQLGDGTTTNRLTPTLVAGGITDWVDISINYYSACSRRSTGQIYCWGDNAYGQLGDGTSTARSIPTLVIGGITDWTDLAIYNLHTCGRRSTGQIYCWGNNTYGQLGDGTSTSRSVPTKVVEP